VQTVTRKCATRERGVTLITAMVFLAVISLVSISSIRSSTMGVRMAQNEESRFSAIQTAQALTEAIIANPNSTPVIGDAGFTICTPGIPGCNMYAVVLPAGYVADEVRDGHLSARIQRMSPPEKPPPRVIGSSVDKFSAASFEVVATYDRTDSGQGHAQLVEGLLVLVPRF